MLQTYLNAIADHRRRQARSFDLGGILMVTVLAVLSDACSYRRVHSFVKSHFKKLKKLLGLSWKRVPSYAGIRRIIQGVSSVELEKTFRLYSAGLTGVVADNCVTLACDGKSLRGSFDNMQDKKMVQLLSVFAVHDRIILAHHEIDEKSNEIPAFQQLVGELGLTGKVFTLDAMHCQKKPCSL